MDVGAVVLHVHVDLFAVWTSIDLCVPVADCEPEGQSRQVPPSRRLRGWARRTYQERTSSTSRRGRREELRRTQGRNVLAMKLPELKYVLNFHREVVISSDARRPPLEIAPEPEPNYFNDDV